jgi:PhnB protein
MAVKPIPEGYNTLSPSLIVDGAADAIEFYKRAFGATERGTMHGPDGKIAHAELQLGDSVLMLADEFPDAGAKGPSAYGGSPVSLTVYVEDVDATFERAAEAGATVVWPLENKFYGDRAATFDDPFGHRWTINSHVEDVSPEEMGRRAAEIGQS